MVWLRSRNFSLYFGNAADLSLTSRTDRDDRTLEVDLANAMARIRMTVRKEVLVGGSWVAEANEGARQGERYQSDGR
jgi:hypothetical protein